MTAVTEVKFGKMIIVNESLITGGEITSNEGRTENMCCPVDSLRGRSLIC